MEPDYPGNMYISYKGLEILCSGLRGINANNLFITIHSINDKKSECMRVHESRNCRGKKWNRTFLQYTQKRLSIQSSLTGCSHFTTYKIYPILFGNI